jgi:hypothetical protein
MKTLVKLIPKTRRAKNKIHEHGEIWEWDKTMAVRLQRSHTAQTKDRVFLISEKDKDWRWIHPTDDPDFIMEVL